MIGLFGRIGTLYKARAKEYQIYDGDEYSADFKLWCWKLNGLTPAQFKAGVELMEAQEESARRTGDDSWPPSYAGFRGMATMRRGPPAGTFERLPPPSLTKEQRRELLRTQVKAITHSDPQESV